MRGRGHPAQERAWRAEAAAKCEREGRNLGRRLSRGFGLLKYCLISRVLPPSQGGGGVRSPSGREVSRHADCRARCCDHCCLHRLRRLVGLVDYSRDCFQRAFEKALQLADADPRGRSRRRVRGPGPIRAFSSDASVSAPTGSGVEGFFDRKHCGRNSAEADKTTGQYKSTVVSDIAYPSSPAASRASLTS